MLASESKSRCVLEDWLLSTFDLFIEWLSKSESSSFVSAPSFSMAILAELSTFSFFWPSTVFDPVLIDLFLSDVWPEVVVLILLITFELSLFDDPFSAVGTLSKIAKLDLFARHWMSCAYYNMQGYIIPTNV